jgi:hypothetical protein
MNGTAGNGFYKKKTLAEIISGLKGLFWVLIKYLAFEKICCLSKFKPDL